MASKSMDVFEENERKATDVPFLIVKGVFMLILVSRIIQRFSNYHSLFAILQVCFLGYCYAYSDLDRLEIGYDDCGNVCGFANKLDDKLACKVLISKFTKKFFSNQKISIKFIGS
jgi:hypothetical protein